MVRIFKAHKKRRKKDSFIGQEQENSEPDSDLVVKLARRNYYIEV